MPEKIYNLYTRCDEGREPKVAVPHPDTDRAGVPYPVVGDTVQYVPKYGYRRGSHVWSGTRYKDLQERVRQIADEIGMPKSRVWDIFDWNQT